jgi:hypothetical protein
VPELLDQYGYAPTAGSLAVAAGLESAPGKLLSWDGFSRMIDATPMLLASVWYRNLHDDGARQAMVNHSHVQLATVDAADATV